MSEQLKINIPEEVCLTTIRTQNSRLWFVNNKKLEEEVLSYLAKYQNIYGVVLYAFILIGNHYHMVAKFPKKATDTCLKKCLTGYFWNSCRAAFFHSFRATAILVWAYHSETIMLIRRTLIMWGNSDSGCLSSFLCEKVPRSMGEVTVVASGFESSIVRRWLEMNAFPI